MRRGTRVIAWGFALAALCGAHDALAERLLVLARGDEGHALGERVRGQTTELGVEVQDVDTPADEAREQQLQAAARLALAREADAVAWLSHDDTDADPTRRQLVLRLFLRRAGRLVERPVGSVPREAPAGRTRAPLPSEVLEAAALVVRSTLQAAARGAVVGEPAPAETIAAATAAPVPTLPAPSAPSAATAPTSRAPGDPRAARSTPRVIAPDARPRVSLTIGWQGLWDGHPGVGRHAVAGRGGVAFGAFELGLAVAVAPGEEIVQPNATLVLARHGATLEAAWRGGPWRGVELLLAVSAGAAAYVRATTEASGGFAPTATRATFSPLLGASAALRWAPGPPRGVRPLGELAAGGFVAPATPVLGYDDASGFVATSKPWVVQPWLRLGIGLQF